MSGGMCLFASKLRKFDNDTIVSQGIRHEWVLNSLVWANYLLIKYKIYSVYATIFL